MKKLIIILLLLLLAFPVYAGEVKGTLSGVVIERSVTLESIRAEIIRIQALIMELQEMLNQLREI